MDAAWSDPLGLVAGRAALRTFGLDVIDALLTAWSSVRALAPHENPGRTLGPTLTAPSVADVVAVACDSRVAVAPVDSTVRAGINHCRTPLRVRYRSKVCFGSIRAHDMSRFQPD